MERVVNIIRRTRGHLDFSVGIVGIFDEICLSFRVTHYIGQGKRDCIYLYVYMYASKYCKA